MQHNPVEVMPQYDINIVVVVDSWIEDRIVYGKNEQGEVILLGEYTSVGEATKELLNLHESALNGSVHCMG